MWDVTGGARLGGGIKSRGRGRGEGGGFGGGERGVVKVWTDAY